VFNDLAYYSEWPKVAGAVIKAQTFVYPHAWSDHLTWGSMLIFLLTRGGGPLSLDRLVGLEPAQTHKE